MKHVEKAKEMIQKRIHDEIGLRVNVNLVEPESIPVARARQ